MVISRHGSSLNSVIAGGPSAQEPGGLAPDLVHLPGPAIGASVLPETGAATDGFRRFRSFSIIFDRFSIDFPPIFDGSHVSDRSSAASLTTRPSWSCWPRSRRSAPTLRSSWTSSSSPTTGSIGRGSTIPSGDRRRAAKSLGIEPFLGPNEAVGLHVTPPRAAAGP